MLFYYFWGVGTRHSDTQTLKTDFQAFRHQTFRHSNQTIRHSSLLRQSIPSFFQNGNTPAAGHLLLTGAYIAGQSCHFSKMVIRQLQAIYFSTKMVMRQLQAIYFSTPNCTTTTYYYFASMSNKYIPIPTMIVLWHSTRTKTTASNQKTITRSVFNKTKMNTVFAFKIWNFNSICGSK